MGKKKAAAPSRPCPHSGNWIHPRKKTCPCCDGTITVTTKRAVAEIELTEKHIATIKDAPCKLTGTKRRSFQAQVTLDYLDGKTRRAENVFGWGRKTVELGLNELRTGITCASGYSAVGRRPRLTNSQLDELEQLLLQGATAHGWINDLWTYDRVAEVIRQHFGIGLGYKTVQTIVKERMGWSCQKPKQQLKERDEDEIKRWKTEEFGRIKSEARGRNAYLAFADESGFMLAPTRRRTLAPRGRAPLLDVTNPHGRISTIAAITFSPKRRRANLLFHLLPDNANFNGSLTVTFLRQIQARVRRPVTLVWDAVPFHYSALVTNYLESHSRMLVEEFPPYASELNPVDNVWSYIKFGRLANYAPFDLAQLRKTVTTELLRVQKRPDLLHGFLRRTGLCLDE